MASTLTTNMMGRLLVIGTCDPLATQVDAAESLARGEPPRPLCYHGVRNTASGSIYRLGLTLLDRDDPTKVLARVTSECSVQRSPRRGEATYPTSSSPAGGCFATTTTTRWPSTTAPQVRSWLLLRQVWPSYLATWKCTLGERSPQNSTTLTNLTNHSGVMQPCQPK